MMVTQPISIISRKCSVAFSLGITFGLLLAYLYLGVFDLADIRPILRYPCTHLLTEEQNASSEMFPKLNEDSSSEAKNKTLEVRILCLILTAPLNKEKAKAVNDTWGKRCNVLLFVTTEKSEKLPTVVLDVKESYETLWGKTKKGFIHAHENYLDAADWFMKADDDTYVVMENLRHLLSFYSRDEPVYFGRKFRNDVGQAYMSGGAGYVLSREALKRFVEIALPDADLCEAADEGAEDNEMGKCLTNVNVTSGVSKDADGKGRFFPFEPKHHLIPEYLNQSTWYWEFTNTTSTEGDDCCSETAISFHYIEPDQMYVLDYTIYRLHPHRN